MPAQARDSQYLQTYYDFFFLDLQNAQLKRKQLMVTVRESRLKQRFSHAQLCFKVLLWRLVRKPGEIIYR